MIYSAEIHTPMNTPAAAPMETIIYVAAGMIYVVKIYFPPGSSGLLHVQVRDAGYQLFPTTIGQSFSGDNLSLSFDETYPKFEPPYELRVYSWNLDTDYDHEMQIHFGFVSRDEYIQRFVGSTAIADALKAMTAQEFAATVSRRERVTGLMEAFAGEEK